MSNYYLIRKSIDPKISDDDDKNYDPPHSAELEKWVKTTADEQSTTPDSSGHGNWFKACVTNKEGLEAKELAGILKAEFESRFTAEKLPNDPDGRYQNAMNELSSLDTDAAPEEIIAIICNAELMVKNPNRLNIFFAADSKLFADFRGKMDELVDSRSAEEKQFDKEDAIFKQPENKPENASEKPSTEELLYWIDQSGLLTVLMKKFTPNSKPEEILEQAKKAFNDKMFYKTKRRDSNPEVKEKIQPLLEELAKVFEDKARDPEAKITMLCSHMLTIQNISDQILTQKEPIPVEPPPVKTPAIEPIPVVPNKAVSPLRKFINFVGRILGFKQKSNQDIEGDLKRRIQRLKNFSSIESDDSTSSNNSTPSHLEDMMHEKKVKRPFFTESEEEKAKRTENKPKSPTNRF